MTNGNDLMNDPNIDTSQLNCGLTKREYFAAMAQQGFLSDNNNNDSDKDWFAQKSVLAADALIHQLNQPT